MERTFKSSEELGAFIREQRVSQDLHMYDIEEVTGVVISTISKLENGKTASPSIFVLQEILGVLGYDIEYKVTKRGDSNECN